MSSGNAETRRELYATCKEGSELGAVRDFVSAIRLSKWKDILEGVSKQKLGQLFGILHGHVSAVAEQDEFEDANANYTESGETDSEDLVKNLMLFRSTAEFALAHLMSCSSPRQIAQNALDTLQVLHDTIFTLGGPEGEAARQAILRACVQAWEIGDGIANTLMVQCLPALLLIAVSPDATAADFKRLWQVRASLGLFDLEDESSQSLRQLCLQAFLSPKFLATKERRRFLEHAMGEDAGLCEDAFEAVLGALPGARAATLDAYGDMIFRAWVRVHAVAQTGDAGARAARDCIEQFWIEGLAHRAATAARPATFSAARRVLRACLVGNKQHAGADGALWRCYEPALWACLRATNGQARLQALLLLLDAFPMGDASEGRESHDECMRTQFKAVTSALRDDSPVVRAAAVEGAFGILGKFWELVPAHTTKKLLARLMGECARDAASTAVRAAVVKGLGFVLDNVLSHDVLKQVLPSIAPLLHDRSDRVRAEVAKLLRAVQGLRTMSFADIVDPEQVLARLALDAAVPEVAAELSGILIPSLFPEDASVSELLSRTVKCMKTHPAAGLAFYANLHHHVAPTRVCRLVLVVHKAIKKACAGAAPAPSRRTRGGAALGSLAAAPRAGQKRGRDAEDGADMEEQEEEEEEPRRRGKLRADNTILMASLLRVAHVAWASVADEMLPRAGQGDSMAKARRRLLEAWGGPFLGGCAEAMLGLGNSEEEARTPWDSSRCAVLASLLGIAGLMPEPKAGAAPASGAGASKKGRAGKRKGRRGGKKSKASDEEDEDEAGPTAAAGITAQEAMNGLVWPAFEAAARIVGETEGVFQTVEANGPAATLVGAAVELAVARDQTEEVAAAAVSGMAAGTGAASGAGAGAATGDVRMPPAVAVLCIERLIGSAADPKQLRETILPALDPALSSLRTHAEAAASRRQGAAWTSARALCSAGMGPAVAAAAIRALCRAAAVDALGPQADAPSSAASAAAPSSSSSSSSTAAAAATADATKGSTDQTQKRPGSTSWLRHAVDAVLGGCLPLLAGMTARTKDTGFIAAADEAAVARAVYDSASVLVSALSDCAGLGACVEDAALAVRVLDCPDVLDLVASVPPQTVDELREGVDAGKLRCAFAGDAGTDGDDEDEDEDEQEDTGAGALASLGKNKAGRKSRAGKRGKGKGKDKPKARTRAQVTSAHRPHLAAFAQRLCYRLTVAALAPPKTNPAFRQASSSSAKAAASLAAALVVCPGAGCIAPTGTTAAVAFALGTPDSAAARARSGWRSTVALHARKGALGALAEEAVVRLLKQVEASGAAQSVVVPQAAAEGDSDGGRVVAGEPGATGTMGLAPAGRVLLGAFLGGAGDDESRGVAIAQAVGEAAATRGVALGQGGGAGAAAPGAGSASSSSASAAASDGAATAAAPAVAVSAASPEVQQACMALLRAVGADAPTEVVSAALATASGSQATQSAELSEGEEDGKAPRDGGFDDAVSGGLRAAAGSGQTAPLAASKIATEQVAMARDGAVQSAGI